MVWACWAALAGSCCARTRSDLGTGARYDRSVGAVRPSREFTQKGHGRRPTPLRDKGGEARSNEALSRGGRHRCGAGSWRSNNGIRGWQPARGDDQDASSRSETQRLGDLGGDAYRKPAEQDRLLHRWKLEVDGALLAVHLQRRRAHVGHDAALRWPPHPRGDCPKRSFVCDRVDHCLHLQLLFTPIATSCAEPAASALTASAPASSALTTTADSACAATDPTSVGPHGDHPGQRPHPAELEPGGGRELVQRLPRRTAGGEHLCDQLHGRVALAADELRVPRRRRFGERFHTLVAHRVGPDGRAPRRRYRPALLGRIRLEHACSELPLPGEQQPPVDQLLRPERPVPEHDAAKVGSGSLRSAPDRRSFQRALHEVHLHAGSVRRLRDPG